jgi:RNA polymerase sigma factor (sigma-70 family)
MAAAGEAAFLELYTAHAERLHTYCLRLTGSADDAADALQDTFTAVLGRLQSGAGPIAHPKAYLYATARHACLRRLGERGRLDVVADVPEAEPPAGPAAGEQAVLTDELRAEVRAAHERLPARQREVLFLREVEELSYADIGDVMELSPNGAAQLAWRARAGLRSDLRHAALLAVASAGDDCDRARTLLGLREDDALDPADDAWLDQHLAGCERCRASRGLLLEAGMTYRAVLPLAALPLTAEDAFAHALAASGAPGAGPPGDGGAGGSGGLHLPGRRTLAGAVTGAALFGMLLLASTAEEPPRRAAVAAAVPAGGPPAPERTFASAARRVRDEAPARERTRAAPVQEDAGAASAAEAAAPAREGDEDAAPDSPRARKDAVAIAEREVEATVPAPVPPERLTPASGREPAPAAPVAVAPEASSTPPAPAPPAAAAPDDDPDVELPPVRPEPEPEPPAKPCDPGHGNTGSSGPGSACDPCPRKDEPKNGEGPPLAGAALRITLCVRLGVTP